MTRPHREAAHLRRRAASSGGGSAAPRTFDGVSARPLRCFVSACSSTGLLSVTAPATRKQGVVAYRHPILLFAVRERKRWAGDSRYPKLKPSALAGWTAAAVLSSLQLASGSGRKCGSGWGLSPRISSTLAVLSPSTHPSFQKDEKPRGHPNNAPAGTRSKRPNCAGLCTSANTSAGDGSNDADTSFSWTTGSMVCCREASGSVSLSSLSVINNPTLSSSEE